MSSKTYLQLVNKVLLNLRETQVTDLSATYSQLIGEFVNQAKEKVEAAWRWKVLDTTLSFTTVLSQTRYNLASSASPVVTSSNGTFPTENAEVLKDPDGNWSVFDATTAPSGGLIRLRRVVSERAYALNIYLATQSPVQPNAFAYSWGQNAGVAGAYFYLVGAPTAGRVMQVRMKVPQDDFTTTAGTEVLLVPWRPVVSMATFLACEERGEELSERSSLWKDRHEQELQRSIEKDMNGEEEYSELQNPEGTAVGTLVAGYY